MPSPYISNYGITTITASTTLTAAAHAGHMIVCNAAAGLTVTLHDATGSGNRYWITTIADQTGDLVIAVPDASNTMQGMAILGNDSAGASCFYTADTSDTVTARTAAEVARSRARARARARGLHRSEHSHA